jgi:hypothetical protein
MKLPNRMVNSSLAAYLPVGQLGQLVDGYKAAAIARFLLTMA